MKKFLTLICCCAYNVSCFAANFNLNIVNPTNYEFKLLKAANSDAPICEINKKSTTDCGIEMGIGDTIFASYVDEGKKNQVAFNISFYNDEVTFQVMPSSSSLVPSLGFSLVGEFGNGWVSNHFSNDGNVNYIGSLCFEVRSEDNIKKKVYCAFSNDNMFAGKANTTKNVLFITDLPADSN